MKWQLMVGCRAVYRPFVQNSGYYAASRSPARGKESEEGNWHIEGEDKSSADLLLSLLWCIAAQGSQFAYPFCIILLWKFGRVIMHDATLCFLTPEGWHMDYNTIPTKPSVEPKTALLVTMSPACANKFNGRWAVTWPSTAAPNMANNPTSAQ